MHPAFGRGALRFPLPPATARSLAYLREHTGDDGRSETILCVANLSRQAQAVELDLHEMRERVPVEMIGRSTFPPIRRPCRTCWTLPAYGFYWFLLTEEAESPAWHEPMARAAA